MFFQNETEYQGLCEPVVKTGGLQNVGSNWATQLITDSQGAVALRGPLQAVVSQVSSLEGSAASQVSLGEGGRGEQAVRPNCLAQQGLPLHNFVL